MKRFSQTLLLLLLLCGLLAGCKGADNPVVGTWQCEDAGEQVVYEFKRDGKMEYSVPSLGASITGTYTVSENQITLKLDSGDETRLEFTRQEDQMILSDENGHQVTCTKE